MSSTKHSLPALHEAGKAYVKLGKAMMNDKTTMAELTNLAWDAGLVLQWRILDRTNAAAYDLGES